MKKLLISTLGIGAIVLAAGQAHAASFTVDNFNDGLTDSTLGGPAPKTFTDSVSAPGIIGGTRNVTHNLTVSDSPARRSALFINDDINSFSLSNGTGVNATAGASYGPGLGQTLTGGYFNFRILFYDAPASDPADLTLTVNNGTPQTFEIPLPANSEDDFNFPILLSDLGNPATLDSFHFEVSGPIGYDIEFDQLDYAVPEPMTILGTGLALSALPAMKKAHNKKAK